LRDSTRADTLDYRDHADKVYQMNRLQPPNYPTAAESLQSVAINSLFARSVVERKVDGEVFVDNEASPRSFYVVHPYGMSLLWGDSENDQFNSRLSAYFRNADAARTSDHWVQAYPDSWHPRLRALFPARVLAPSDDCSRLRSGDVVVHTRGNFKFNRSRFEELRQGTDSAGLEIVRTDADTYYAMSGTVIPRNFWNNAEEFLSRGVGFSAFYEGSLAATAFSAFVFDGVLEIGIETVDRHRGRGYALRTCAALIDYCIEHGYEPIWSCSFANKGSRKLAERLGFEPTVSVPYYRVCG
jgi:GNAT superfamily N-acetyltransferase